MVQFALVLLTCPSIWRRVTHVHQPPPEDDLPPPDPEDALYAHLDEIDPPVKPDASSQPMSSTPTAPQPSGALSTPTKAKDPEILPDAPMSQQAGATPKGTKRPLPPPPSLESMPAVVAEPSLLDSALSPPSLAALYIVIICVACGWLMCGITVLTASLSALGS